MFLHKPHRYNKVKHFYFNNYFCLLFQRIVTVIMKFEQSHQTQDQDLVEVLTKLVVAALTKPVVAALIKENVTKLQQRIKRKGNINSNAYFD